MIAALDNYLKGPTLRGKSALELLHLPDPTKSKEERDQYRRYVVPLATASILAMAGPLYGFNVWVLPLCMEIYGPDALYTMRNSLVLLSFSIGWFGCMPFLAFLPQKLLSYSSGQMLLISSCIYNFGLVICGVAVHFRSDVGLLFAQLLLCGPSTVVYTLPAGVSLVSWYREIGNPSLGGALHGFFCGFWATVFSFYGAALAAFDTDNSFFYVAALTFLIQLPGVFLFRTPDELPLKPTDDDLISETVNETTKDDNTKEEDTTKKADGTVAGFKEADVPLMTNAELSRTPQSWIQIFTWTTAFIPGFAVKYTISPVMSSLFHATPLVQSITSAAFLFTYSIARLLTGLFIIPKLTLRRTILLIAGVAPLFYFFIGTIVKLKLLSTAWMVAFIIAYTGIAFTLGAKKIFLYPVCLEMWGQKNYTSMTARAMTAFCVAANIGPLIMWQGLSKAGDVYIDQSKNTSEEQMSTLLSFAGNNLLILAALALVTVISFAFFIKPHVYVVDAT